MTNASSMLIQTYILFVASNILTSFVGVFSNYFDITASLFKYVWTFRGH